MDGVDGAGVAGVAVDAAGSAGETGVGATGVEGTGTVGAGRLVNGSGESGLCAMAANDPAQMAVVAKRPIQYFARVITEIFPLLPLRPRSFRDKTQPPALAKDFRRQWVNSASV